MRSLNQRFIDSKSYAKRKQKEFSFTKEEYLSLISMPCHYCGDKLNPTGIGLDRLDNSSGYFKENVVPCCSDCNRTRNNNYTYEEMLMLSRAIRIIKSLRAS